MIREFEFKVLCQRHCDEIYRYACSLLGNSADAEDATQEGSSDCATARSSKPSASR